MKKEKTVVKVKRKEISEVKPGNRLSTEDIEQMFLTYCHHPRVAFVAEACGVSRSTVRRYREKDHWDSRREKILEDVRRKDDNATAKALSANLKVVRFAKAKLIKKIQSGNAKSASTYGDLDRMIRLEGFLLGQPDSRTAVGRFEHLSDEQLDEKLKQIKAFHV